MPPGPSGGPLLRGEGFSQRAVAQRPPWTPISCGVSWASVCSLQVSICSPAKGTAIPECRGAHHLVQLQRLCPAAFVLSWRNWFPAHTETDPLSRFLLSGRSRIDVPENIPATLVLIFWSVLFCSFLNHTASWVSHQSLKIKIYKFCRFLAGSTLL